MCGAPSISNPYLWRHNAGTFRRVNCDGDNDENGSDLACGDEEGVQPHTTVTVAVFSYDLRVFRTHTFYIFFYIKRR